MCYLEFWKGLPLSSKLDILDIDSMAKHESTEAHRGVAACSGAKRLRIFARDVVDFLTTTTI